MSKVIWQGTALHEWVDYNGHMNDSAYAVAFSKALDAMMDEIGIDETFRHKNRYTIFTLETHLLYMAEVHQDEPLTTEVSVLDRDAKRMHLIFTMKNKAEEIVATSEQMTMGMDQDAGKPSPFPEAIAANIDTLPHISRENWPKQAGRAIGIRKK